MIKISRTCLSVIWQQTFRKLQSLIIDKMTKVLAPFEIFGLSRKFCSVCKRSRNFNSKTLLQTNYYVNERSQANSREKMNLGWIRTNNIFWVFLDNQDSTQRSISIIFLFNSLEKMLLEFLMEDFKLVVAAKYEPENVDVSNDFRSRIGNKENKCRKDSGLRSQQAFLKEREIVPSHLKWNFGFDALLPGGFDI